MKKDPMTMVRGNKAMPVQNIFLLFYHKSERRQNGPTIAPIPIEMTKSKLTTNKLPTNNKGYPIMKYQIK